MTDQVNNSGGDSFKRNDHYRRIIQLHPLESACIGLEDLGKGPN